MYEEILHYNASHKGLVIEGLNALNKTVYKYFNVLLLFMYLVIYC